ncbi:MAG TPA: flagellar basal body rod protein FlgC [Candidatus Kapabacteria bacterium]|jgi:flagellar basal-body rod protein FlgC|nr:flagellar basal body rod protein FlgC [Candidatus Kapabacteria bacterium]HOV91743.1 flagellar basal body rod protein FlgC [Candidatus Kapabacteria bacterium]
MSENIFSTFSISGQGMTVQRMKLSATAKNIANANTTRGVNGKPYQREVVVVRAVNPTPFEQQIQDQLELKRTSVEHGPNIHQGVEQEDTRVITANIGRDNTQERIVYDPSHPDADNKGYVHYPNINIVTEMVEMITAQRAFEANTTMIEAAKNIARNSLEI